jgi:hypothetical protein
VGVQHTETSLIVWSGDQLNKEIVEDSGNTQQDPMIPIFDADRVFDAGDQGCATGPMDEIASIISEMTPGQIIS